MAKTFAQEAKTIMNKYKLRLGEKFDKGDPLALAAMNQELETLQQKQEAARETELGATPQAAPQFAKGGLLPEYGGDDPDQSAFLPTTNFGNRLNRMNQMPIGGTYDQMPSTAAEAMAAQTGSQPAFSNGDPFKSRVPWMGAAAGVIGGLIGNKKLGEVMMPGINTAQ